MNGTPPPRLRDGASRGGLLARDSPATSGTRIPNIHFYQEFTLRSHGVRRAGSAALDLAYTRGGRIDAFWEFHLNPWDTAAGALLVTEAGGTITRFDGEPFLLNSSGTPGHQWLAARRAAKRFFSRHVRRPRSASRSHTG